MLPTRVGVSDTEGTPLSTMVGVSDTEGATLGTLLGFVLMLGEALGVVLGVLLGPTLTLGEELGLKLPEGSPLGPSQIGWPSGSTTELPRLSSLFPTVAVVASDDSTRRRAALSTPGPSLTEHFMAQIG